MTSTASTASWQLAARHLALDAATVETLRALGDAGVDSLLLKGPVTASRLYADDPHRRCYGDIDLLVSPLEFDGAEDALDRAGCRRTHPGLRRSEMSRQEVSWLAAGSDRLFIDLHRTLPGVRDAEGLWQALWAARESMTLQGASLAVPSRVGSALVIALHAASPGCSRQPYRDLARAVTAFDESEWAEAVALARSVGAEQGMAAGFAAVPDARHLLARFGLTHTTVSTATRMATPELSPAGLAIRRVLHEEGLRARMVYLASRAYPSEAAMRKNWWVTGEGTWGLAKARRLRYWRVLLSLPEGIAELRRARRTGSATQASWTAEAVYAVRDQLAQTCLDDVDLAAPDPTTTASQVERGLRHLEATCLERSLVWQRFHAAHGVAHSVVIGVSSPAKGFHAHAWVAEDPGIAGSDAVADPEADPTDDGDLYVIYRRPVPASWMGQS